MEGSAFVKFSTQFIACHANIACKVDIVCVIVYRCQMIRDPIYQRIGALIKAKRKTLGLKQETLANTLRISRGSLANIETGRQSILVHQLYNFAAALQLTPIELLPAIPGDPADEEQSNIPLPPNLNPQQAKQITSLFSQVKTSQNPKKEEYRVNSNKR